MKIPLLPLLLLLGGACHRPVSAAAPADVPLDEARRAWLIDRSLHQLSAHYLFPDVAAKAVAAVRAHQRRGDYAHLGAEAFTQRLSADLFEVAHDRHLSVRFSADPLPQRGAPGGSPSEAETEAAHFDNHGFVRAERLDGNIGYLRIDHFGPPDTAGEIAAAALSFVAHTDALIVDLRENTGGYGPTVDMMVKRLEEAGRPVYLLTGPHTFSGGEGCAYDLQAARRVTVVGERTAGAAHFAPIFPLDEHFEMQIAVDQPINAITGTNWEGTGVKPDVAVPVAQALATAQVLALEGRVGKRADPEQREEVRQALEDARAERDRLRGK